MINFNQKQEFILMNKLFGPIENSKLASNKYKGHNIFLDILILVCFYMIEQTLICISLVPVMTYKFMNDTKYMLTDSSDISSTLEVSMKILEDPAVTLTMLFGTIFMIIPILIYTVKIEKWPFRAMGIKKEKMPIYYLIGALVGFAVFSFAVFICKLLGAIDISYSNDNMKYLIPVFILGWMVQGFSEELCCRGWLMVSIGRKYSTLTAIVVNSIIFASLHILNPGLTILAIINLFLFGVLASVMYLITENIWMVAAVHSVWNLVQGNFYGIQVSGNPLVTSIFQTTLNQSKTLVNGGDFGLEGGLGVTISNVIAIVILYIIYWKKKNKED